VPTLSGPCALSCHGSYWCEEHGCTEPKKAFNDSVFSVTWRLGRMAGLIVFERPHEMRKSDHDMHLKGRAFELLILKLLVALSYVSN